MNNIPYIFCITLENSNERIQPAKNQLDNLNVKYDLFYGIDGSKTNFILRSYLVIWITMIKTD